MSRQDDREKETEHQSLLLEVGRIEQQFEVSSSILKLVTNAMVDDLARGLTSVDGSIPMHLTWVFNRPTGEEQGTFLGIDLGRTIKGTNLRVCEVTFSGKGEFDITQSSFRVPDDVKMGTSEQLWGFVAESVKTFLDLNEKTAGKNPQRDIHLAFTFSFPVVQHSIDEAILKGWLRGFTVKGVEGHDVVNQLQHALTEKGIRVKVIAVLNDCVGTLVASAYADTSVMLGCIFGTGTSGAYFERCGQIPKLAHEQLPADLQMAVNCQWGEFKNAALPLNDFDRLLDNESDNPGQQIYEKTIAGMYLPELLRLVMLRLHKMFPTSFMAGHYSENFQKPYCMDAACLRMIEGDPYENLFESGDYLGTQYNVSMNLFELRIVRRIAEAIGKRAARLSACVLAALCMKMGTYNCSIGVDGSLFLLYPNFSKRISIALAEILDWNPNRTADPIKLLAAEDGNGVGASLIAAMTMSRVRNGDTFGIKDQHAIF